MLMSWLRGQDLNLRPSGYEPDELPGCSTPRWCSCVCVCCLCVWAGWKTWRRPTLPRLGTQYHGRWGFSRPSSGWDRVVTPRQSHQVVQPALGRLSAFGCQPPRVGQDGFWCGVDCVCVDVACRGPCGSPLAPGIRWLMPGPGVGCCAGWVASCSWGLTPGACCLIWRLSGD